MPIIGPHLVGCRTHLLKRTVCLACPTVLAAGELVTWMYVEENEQTLPGTTMFACLSHDSEELEFFAFPEIRRRATEARARRGRESWPLRWCFRKTRRAGGGRWPKRRVIRTRAGFIRRPCAARSSGARRNSTALNPFRARFCVPVVDLARGRAFPFLSLSSRGSARVTRARIMRARPQEAPGTRLKLWPLWRESC